MESMVQGMEGAIIPLLQFLRLIVEFTAAFWIVVGVFRAAVGIFSAHIHNQPERFNSVRLRFSRYLSLALEFQLAADLLSTAISPTFEELGKVAVTAVIRTGLNYFLSKEMKAEQLELSEQREARAEARPGDAYHPVYPPAVRA
jgi:uncharacterized membrane protein